MTAAPRTVAPPSGLPAISPTCGEIGQSPRVNLFAGMGSHQSAKSQTNTWFSPPDILAALGGADSFDLDPCSHVERPWPTAKQHYTQEDNGLILPWSGRVWLNPPYSIALITRFLGRMAAHGQGTALIFARTETDPFHRFVWQAATGLLFLRGRLNFHVGLDTWFERPGEPPLFVAAGGRAPANGGAPSVLIAYGDDDRDILAAAPIDGHFVPLRLPVSILVSALSTTWREALDGFFARHDGPVALADLYRAFAEHPKSRKNQHWRDKLRQVLQRGQFERVDKGLWQRRAA
jgi:hypothetical protein